MKKENLIILITTFFLSISCINPQNFLFSLSNGLLYQKLSEEKNNKNNTEIDYLDLLISIITNIEENCGKELENYLNDTKNKFSLLKYPQMIDYIGKSINDLGDEIECRKIFKKYNITYVIGKIDSDILTNKTDKELIDFLEVKNFCIGFCIPGSCKLPVIKLLYMFMNVLYNDNITDNNTLLTEDEYYFKKDNNFILYLFIIISIYLIIKLIFGIIRITFCVKGYDKYANKLLNDQGKTGSFSFDSELDIDDKRNSIYLDNKGEPNIYDPNFDFTSSFPIYLRIVKFLDLFNDFQYYFSKRNRYFNDNGLEGINFIRTVVLYLLIFSNTIHSLVSLPSKDILNNSFINKITILCFKISNVSLNYWIVLEAAYTSFKLMKFIKAQMYIYNKKNRKNYKTNLLIIFGKFILLFIPKIFSFLLCYYIFYYNVIKFRKWFGAKTTFKYITENIIERNITCNNNIFNMFNISSNSSIFSIDIPKFKACYDFIYVYINMFLCSFVFMIILYLSFIIKQKIFEIILIILNVISFFVLLHFVNDDKIKKETKYTYYHLKGQEYTTKIFYLFLGVYNFGYILGILCFNYDNNKDSFNQKKNKKKSNDKNMITNEDYNIAKQRDNDDDNKISKKFNLKYYPFSFFNKFLELINNINATVRIFIILICLILMILLSLIDNFEHNKNGYTLLNKKFYNSFSSSKIDFLYYKHISLILFFVINIIIITLPKKGIYKQVVNIKLFTCLSRIGFTVTCLYYIFSYFSFCEFLVKIKYNIITFTLISIGNFLIVIIICLFFNIIFELPIRIVIKKLLRRNKANKNKVL